MQVIVDGLVTSYERLGKGQKTILLLHGWGDSAKGLHAFATNFAADYTVLILDLPGFGGTQSPQEAWGLNDYAKFVHDFLAKLEIKTIHAIVGHSNGGAIALRGIAIAQLKTNRLVLLATAGIRGLYKGRMKALRYVVKTGKALTAPLPKSMKSKLRRKIYSTVGSDMLVAEHLQETFKKIVTDDVRTDAKAIMVPTLLIYGEQDEQTPASYGEAFHELIQGSTLIVLPGAGHFVHHDRPKEVVQSVKDFLP